MRSGISIFIVVVALLFFTACASFPDAGAGGAVTLWHAFEGAEEKVLLDAIADYNRTNPRPIRAVSQSPEFFVERIEAARASRRGPDLFIWAHDVVGSLAERGLIAPFPLECEAIQPCRAAVTWNGRTWGLPFVFETLILYYNRRLVPEPPATTDELIRIGRQLRLKGIHGLVYDRANLYYHAAWLHGFGGALLDDKGVFDPTTPAMIRSLEFARDLVRVHRISPDTADHALSIKLFNAEKTGMIISGPWAFGLLDRRLDFGMAPLPVVSATGRQAAPFLGVKAIFLSAGSPRAAAARRAAAFLASPAYASRFSILTFGLPAERTAYDYSLVTGDFVTMCFKDQIARTCLMPNRPEIRRVWPAMMSDRRVDRRGALERILIDGEAPLPVLNQALEEFRRSGR